MQLSQSHTQLYSWRGECSGMLFHCLRSIHAPAPAMWHAAALLMIAGKHCSFIAASGGLVPVSMLKTLCFGHPCFVVPANDYNC